MNESRHVNMDVNQVKNDSHWDVSKQGLQQAAFAENGMVCQVLLWNRQSTPRLLLNELLGNLSAVLDVQV